MGAIERILRQSAEQAAKAGASSGARHGLLDQLRNRYDSIEVEVPRAAWRARPPEFPELPVDWQDLADRAGVDAPLERAGVSARDYKQRLGAFRPDGSSDGPIELSYADVADPYYDKVGGLMRQLELSDQAARNYRNAAVDPAARAAAIPPRMTPLGALTRRPVAAIDLPEGTQGMFRWGDGRPSGGEVVLDTSLASRGVFGDTAEPGEVLAHELHHAASMFGGNPGGTDYANWPGMLYSYSDSAKALKMPLLGRLLGARRGRWDYLTDLAETDARLAGVRRLFSYNTGRSVKNLRDAEAAWNWYDRHALYPGYVDPKARPVDPVDWAFFRSMSPDERRLLMARMTMVPAVLAPLAAGTQETDGR